MRKYARQYISKHIRIDLSSKNLELPGLLKTYWADFGGNKLKVLRRVTRDMKGAGKEYDDLLQISKENFDLLKTIKLSFSNLDWTPCLLLDK